jgi:hypothetical protein
LRKNECGSRTDHTPPLHGMLIRAAR